MVPSTLNNEGTLSLLSEEQSQLFVKNQIIIYKKSNIIRLLKSVRNTRRRMVSAVHGRHKLPVSFSLLKNSGTRMGEVFHLQSQLTEWGLGNHGKFLLPLDLALWTKAKHCSVFHVPFGWSPTCLCYSSAVRQGVQSMTTAQKPKYLYKTT